MFSNILLLAATQMTFPAGTAENPSVIAPLSPVTPAVRFWWDDTAFHAGRRAYPWSELGTVPTNGATFKIDFGVIDRTNFDRDKVVLEGRIDRTASAYRLDSFGMFGNAPISNRVTFVTQKDGSVQCLFYADSAAPNYVRFHQSAAAKAGVPASILVTAKGPSSGSVTCTLTDVDGRTIYSVKGPYRDPKLSFDFCYLWTDIKTKTLHLVTDVWRDDAGCKIRLTSSDLLTGAARDWTKTIDVPPAWGRKDLVVPTDDLPPGIYKFTVEYLDPAGAVVHSDIARYYMPDGKAPWEGTELGNEDTVPPPWTTPVFGKTTFDCWNRRVTFGGKGVVSSILSGGKELLAEPATILLNGRPLAFDVTGVDRKVSEATYHLKARGANIRADVRCEFDGYLRFAFTFPTSVSSLAWRVAGSTAEISGMEGFAGGGVMEPVGKGVTIDRPFNVDKRPSWWMSGRVGLMGGPLNLHGYHVRELEKSGRFQSSDKSVVVTTTFVDEPMKEGPDRTVLFYLEPTPVKPKDNAFSSVPQDRLCFWTDYPYRHYETKYPGLECPGAFENLRKVLKKGKRVFYYNGTKGYSPESPFWSRYQQDWNAWGLGYYCHEVPLSLERRAHRNWTWACVNSKSFRESKIWGMYQMMTVSEPDAKDLYFDLAAIDIRCGNTYHGCTWQDDFGRWMQDFCTESLREIHKRCYRIVKAKNADGVMYGHIGSGRFPGDVFFDLQTRGEEFSLSAYQHGRTYGGVFTPTYYDLFTPEFVQSRLLPSCCERTVYMGPQFGRAIGCHGSAAVEKTFNENRAMPELQTAFRHYAAYVKIHDINIAWGSLDNPEWRVYYLTDNAVRNLGAKRVHHAYYLGEDGSVALSKPGPRQLWAYYHAEDAGVLIVLNDTDETIDQTVTVKGLAVPGKDILDETDYAFTNGAQAFRLGPREARFIRFDFTSRK